MQMHTADQGPVLQLYLHHELALSSHTCVCNIVAFRLTFTWVFCVPVSTTQLSELNNMYNFPEKVGESASTLDTSARTAKILPWSILN